MIDDHPAQYSFEDFVLNAQNVIEIIEEKDIPVMHLASDKVKAFVLSTPFCSYLSLHLEGFCDILIVNNCKESSNGH